MKQDSNYSSIFGPYDDLNKYSRPILRIYQFYFSGGKATIFEGGVRVPGFIHGPKNYFPKSFDFNGLFHISDFYPTILEMIGEQGRLKSSRHTAMDGISQYTALQGNTNISPRKNVHIHR